MAARDPGPKRQSLPVSKPSRSTRRADSRFSRVGGVRRGRCVARSAPPFAPVKNPRSRNKPPSVPNSHASRGAADTSFLKHRTAATSARGLRNVGAAFRNAATPSRPSVSTKAGNAISFAFPSPSFSFSTSRNTRKLSSRDMRCGTTSKLTRKHTNSSSFRVAPVASITRQVIFFVLALYISSVA